MIKKTKRGESIIEIASEIFRKYGFKKTTVDDIADAAHKGKSSLYYYFKSKEDLFKAVVGKEAESLKSVLTEIVGDDTLNPEAKFRKYIATRMEKLKELVNYYDALTNDYLSHYSFINKIRKQYDNEEQIFITKMLEEGVRKGKFEIPDTSIAAYAIVIAMKGLEIPIFVTKEIDNPEEKIFHLLNILFHGISKKCDE
ncbi:MAG: TetR/AcrR family transcriptional regulator [Bacteroidales bacterium]|nr:TetR/AcrR family transcriptional regulator [Bacteroidales bacterium]